MANLSDFDHRQMDGDWQSRQPEAVVRSLLTRTLDDLRVARDRLNQNPKNSSRPSGSMPPWQGRTDTSKGDDGDVDDTLLLCGVDSDSTDDDNNSDTPECPKGDAPQSNTDAVAQTSPPLEAQSKPANVLNVPQKKRPGPNRLRCWAHLLRKLCGVAESTVRSASRHGQAMLAIFKDPMQAAFNAKSRPR